MNDLEKPFENLSEPGQHVIDCSRIPPVNFFLDTADVDYCRRIMDGFHATAPHRSYNLLGITTNPSALSKMSVDNYDDMKKIIVSLCEFVTEFRNGRSFGTVYVQLPNSNISIADADKYIELVSGFSDGITKIGLKIPPFQKYLNEVKRWSKVLDVNVTGIADCSTALRCLSYNVKYVSIIPGRMEERGIDANAHLDYTNKRNRTYPKSLRGVRVITGSMRTIEGLRNAVLYNTFPTIGWRVLDKIIEEGRVNEVLDFWNEPLADMNCEYSPEITKENTKLSVEFFEQMDGLGQKLYNKLLGEK